MGFFNYTTFVVCLVGLLAAACEIPLAWTSPIYPKLYSSDSSINPLGRPITEDEDTWLGSLLNIGGLFGAFPFLYITHKFGSKPGLLAMAVPITISYFIAAFAKELYLFYIVRILAGISTGGCYALVANYIVDVSEDNNRGRMSQMLNVFWSFGTFIVYSIGPFLSIRDFNLILGCIPAAFFILFLLLAPESPYHLVRNNRMQEATKAIQLLRPKHKECIENELDHIKKSLQEKEKRVSITELILNPSVRRMFCICIVLVMAQDLCGFSVILFYMQIIFDAAGMTLTSDISSLIVAFCMLLSSFVSPYLVERSGRRPLTIVSLLGMGIALGALGGYFFANDVPDAWTWIPLAALILYKLSYNFGISTVPYTLICEVFPPQIKNTASTIVPLFSWAIAFVVTYTFNAMSNAVGHAGTFWIFAGFAFVISFFSILLVPETKGKSFLEIQDMIETGPVIQICTRSIERVKIPI